MKTEELLPLYDKDLRENVEYPETRKEVTPAVVPFTRKAPAI